MAITRVVKRLRESQIDAIIDQLKTALPEELEEAGITIPEQVVNRFLESFEKDLRWTGK